jgi:hypothetical protein
VSDLLGRLSDVYKSPSQPGWWLVPAWEWEVFSSAPTYILSLKAGPQEVMKPKGTGSGASGSFSGRGPHPPL